MSDKELKNILSILEFIVDNIGAINYPKCGNDCKGTLLPCEKPATDIMGYTIRKLTVKYWHCSICKKTIGKY